MPGNEQTLQEIITAVRQRLQAINANATHVTDLEIRLKLRAQIAELERALDASLGLHAVPLPLCHALRSPAGTIQTVPFAVDGRTVRAVIHPLGHADAQREVKAWQDITGAVAAHLAVGEQLRRMDPALAVLGIGTATLVNTEQSRTAARAALHALRYSVLLPAPLMWLWERARQAGRTSRRATTAAVMSTTVAAIAYTSWALPVETEQPPAPPGVIVETPQPLSPTVAPPSQSAPSDHVPTADGAPLPSPTGPAPRPTSTRPEAKPSPTGPAQSTPEASPRRSQPPAEPSPAEPASTGQTSPPRPDPTARPEPTARPAPTRPSASATSRPSPPAPTPDSPSPSSPTAPPAPTCRLVDVNVPILGGVGVCL